MSKSPKVVIRSRFTPALSTSDSSSKNIYSRINGMFNYYTREEKRALDMFDYYVGNINKDTTMNLILENGKYATNSDIEKRKVKYRDYIQDSNLWQLVISFNNDYINENVTIEQLEQKMIKEVIPRFFKECGFDDLKNLSYQISLHTDTDNLHFHFSFIEKKPNYNNSVGKITYRKQGKLKKSEINFLKNQTALSIEREKLLTPMIIKTNKEIDFLKQYFNPKEKNFLLRNKKDLILEYKLLELGKLISESRTDGNNRKIKYNSIKNEEIKTLTKEIKKHIFKDKNSPLYNHKKELDKELTNINDLFYSLNKDNNISKTKFKADYVKQKSDYIDNYIFNAIVNHANYNYKNNKIKTEHIIQEVAYKQYKKNKINRKDLLLNYFSSSNNKFKYKKEFEQALRHLNYEMDQATKEFSNLFKEDDSNEKGY